MIQRSVVQLSHGSDNVYDCIHLLAVLGCADAMDGTVTSPLASTALAL